MIGILLVTHNGLGDSLVDCVRHVMGDVPPNLKVLSVQAQDCESSIGLAARAARTGSIPKSSMPGCAGANGPGTGCR